MKRFVVFLILFISTKSLTFSQVYQTFGTPVKKYVFGVRINTSWSSTVTFFRALENGKKLTDVTILPKDDFIREIMGLETSPANPDTINLFKKYDIVNPTVIDSLWKLKYAVYPFARRDADTLGWTNNFQNPYLPTSKQKRILYNLGMDTLTYVIYGDKFFALLKAMNNPAWIKNYKNAK